MPAARVEAALRIPADHPAFDGHFPGHPIVPAVVLVAEVLAAIESATGIGPQAWTLTNAKFQSPVTPGAALGLWHEQTATGARRFEVRAAGALVSSGTFDPAPSA